MEMLANDKVPPDGVGSIKPPTMGDRQVLEAVTVSYTGWVLDLFDLSTLLPVALVIGKLFFPSEHAMLSLATVCAPFMVTLLMRPLGSAIFDSYMDQRRRRGAMVVAVTGAGMSTTASGLLSTVSQIGLFASALFILLRLIQGVFVGGMAASAHTIDMESAPSSWRGAVSGLMGGGGTGIGVLLISVTYMTVTMLFPGDAFEIWRWRCMFFVDVISSVLRLVIFNLPEESPLWKQLQATETHVKPGAHLIWILFLQKYREILLVDALLTIGGGSVYYLMSDCLPAFLKVVIKVPAGESAVLFMVSSLAVIVALVTVGHLSSLVGRKHSFLLIGVTTLVFLSLFYQWLPIASTMTARFAYTASLSMLGCTGFVPILVFLNE